MRGVLPCATRLLHFVVDVSARNATLCTLRAACSGLGGTRKCGALVRRASMTKYANLCDPNSQTVVASHRRRRFVALPSAVVDPVILPVARSVAGSCRARFGPKRSVYVMSPLAVPFRTLCALLAPVLRRATTRGALAARRDFFQHALACDQILHTDVAVHRRRRFVPRPPAIAKPLSRPSPTPSRGVAVSTRP